nr:polyprotein [Potato virus B]
MELVPLSEVVERIVPSWVQPMKSHSFGSFSFGRVYCRCGGMRPTAEMVDLVSALATPTLNSSLNKQERRKLRRKRCPFSTATCRPNSIDACHLCDQACGDDAARDIPQPEECPHCSGTGIVRSKEWDLLRTTVRENRKTFQVPSLPLHEHVLQEGLPGAWRYRSCIGYTSKKHPTTDVNTWMQAAAIVRSEPDFWMRTDDPYLQRDIISGGDGGYDPWCYIAPTKHICAKIFDWWHTKYTPGYDCPNPSFDDFDRRKMGPPRWPLYDYQSVRTPQRGVTYVIPKGDTDYFNYCVDSLSSELEFFLDEFYDCAATFDGELNLSIGNVSQKPYRAHFETSRLKISIVDKVYLANAYKMVHYQEPVQVMAYGQDDVEDQLDHLENKQGGEVFSTPNFINMLKAKKKEVRGKDFAGATEGRIVRSADLELSKQDVFLTNSLMEKMRKSRIIKRFAGMSPLLTRMNMDITNKDEIVRYPVKELQCTTDGTLSAQTFTVLERPKESLICKMSEEGWKEAKSVCLNLHVRSYLPTHVRVYAFCVIMWGHSSNAEVASLSGSYLYLGDGEASMLQLPLICNPLGNELQDQDAYRRSLVLSTSFFGPTGFKPGQPIFGITAVEFTEYMPTSHGGISHEQDSWDKMLQAHQGPNKQRFISGYNVVDVIESGADKTVKFPEFSMSAVPSHQPVVRKFNDNTGDLRVQRSTSMRIKNFSRYTGGNIPVVNHFDYTQNNAPGVGDVGRNSTSVVHDPILQTIPTVLLKDAGKDTNCFASDLGPMEYIGTEMCVMPPEARAGHIMRKISLLDTFRRVQGSAYNRWLNLGYMDCDIAFVSHLAGNAYSGVTVYFVLDCYNRLPESLSTEAFMSQITQFPLFIHVLSDSETSMHVIPLRKIVGHTVHVGGDAFANPTLYVVCGSRASSPVSVDGHFDVEFYTSGPLYDNAGFAPDSLLQYPIADRYLGDLDIVLPTKIIGIGSAAPVSFPLSWALPRTEHGFTSYSFGSAILSHFLGVAGTLDFTLYVVSSIFTSCKLRVLLWNSLPSNLFLPRIPHIDVESRTQRMQLRIQDPFVSSSTFGDTGAQLIVVPLCTVYTPEHIDSAFEFGITIHGIVPDSKLCRTINYTNKFAWFMMKVNTPSGMTAVDVPARCVNLKHAAATFQHFVNPFTTLCSTTGLHGGDVILHFYWSLDKSKKKMSDLTGSVVISSGMGPPTDFFRGEIKMFNMLECKASVPIQFGTFSGVAPSTAPNHIHLNWIRFALDGDWEVFNTLHVSIEVLPGFSFYGRTAGPFSPIGSAVDTKVLIKEEIDERKKKIKEGRSADGVNTS